MFLNKKWLLFPFIVLFIVACSNNKMKPDHRVITQPNWPKNINLSKNHIEFVDQATLGKLAKKWKNNKKVVIAHFGDSHVQPGWQVAPIRQLLQTHKGNAGRGMIFPYAIAKTYSQEDYTSHFTGKWRTANSIQQPPKIGVGVSGFVAVTEDSYTQVRFNFKDSAPALGKVKAILLYRAIGGEYEVDLENGSSGKKAIVKPSLETKAVRFDLGYSSTINLHIRKQNHSARSFEIHGLILENENQKGVVYHNLGVGGAAFKALIQQQHFERQFPLLNADLVILDWGTNDILYTNSIAPDLEQTVRLTIRKIKQANPNTAILLTSAQEARYKGNDITSSATFSALMRKIAKQENVMFYDWYQISGGHKSVENWKHLGFASKDNIHLNAKGYRIRAELLSKALLSAISSLD